MTMANDSPIPPLPKNPATPVPTPPKDARPDKKNVAGWNVENREETSHV